MSGKSAFLLKFSFALIFTFLGILALHAQTVPRPTAPDNSDKFDNDEWQRGQTQVAGAVVYKAADFDAPVVGHLKLGTRWLISKKVYGAFHQVRLPGQKIGYVTDMDITPVRSGSAKKKEMQEAKAKAKARGESLPESKRRREGAYIDENAFGNKAHAFDKANFQGVTLHGLHYTESTMGLHPADNLFLIGFKASGEDVVIEGLPTEMNVEISLGAPKYYEQATGRSTDGFLFLFDTQIQNVTLHDENTMSVFGIGPVFRFSKFGVTLPVNGKDQFYSLEDMAIGAKFAYGVARRFGSFAARLEAQYYWEKNQYYGLSLSLQYGNPAR